MQDTIFLDHIQEKMDNRPFAESEDSKGKGASFGVQSDFFRQGEPSIFAMTGEHKKSTPSPKSKGQKKGVIDTTQESASKAKIEKPKNAEKIKGQFGQVVTKLKKVKHIEFYVAGVAIALMLLIYFSTSIFGGVGSKSVDKPTMQAPMTYDEYIIKKEAQVGRMIGQIKGVGESDVAINFESSVEYVLAVIVSETGSGKTETPILVTENGVTKPIILKEIYPKALGVFVVCQGANNAAVRTAILDGVSAMLDIAKDKIVLSQKG
ncbi:MAG: hypothetical protein FWD76_04735 [Firmicutes bacterium]|nr:hypothetical protein [Bacillota bacterium]